MKSWTWLKSIGQIIINMYSNSFSHYLNNPSSPRFDRNVLFAEIQQQSDIHVELIRVLVQISIDSICHVYLLLLNGLHIHRTRHLLHHFPQFCLEVDFVMVFLSQQRFQIGQINKILIFFHFCFPEFIVEHICASVVFVNITIAIILRFESPKCFDKPSPVMTCSQCLGVVISNEQVVASFKLISYLLNFGRASHRKNSVSQASQFLSLFELGHIIRVVGVSLVGSVDVEECTQPCCQSYDIQQFLHLIIGIQSTDKINNGKQSRTWKKV